MINGVVTNGAALNAGAASGDQPEDVRETAVVTSITHSAEFVDVRDSLVGTSAAWPYVYREDIAETAVVTGDNIVIVRWMTVRSTGVVTSSHDTIRLAPVNIRDDLLGTDRTYLQTIATEDVTDSAVVTGDAESLTPDIDVLETAVVTGEASYSLTVRYVVRDSAVITDATSTGGAVDVFDTAVATGGATPYRIARYVVSETAVIVGADDLGLAQELVLDVRDSAIVIGYADNRLDARLDIREIAYLSDNMVSSDGLVGVDGLPVDSVWTASVYSWGMSRHSGTGITQRGTRFAVSPDGLYELGTGYSIAEVDTGFMGLGTKALKHVSSIYLQGSRDGDMTVTVTADRNGARAVHSYTPIDRAHGDSRSVRVDIGRGYRSTYYKLHIQTTARFELFGGGLLVAPTQRRI